MWRWIKELFSIWIFNSYSMIQANFDGIRDLLKQKFCRNQSKGVNILTETHINLDQIYHIRNNWLGPIFFSPGYSHTKWLLVLLHSGLEGVTKVGTNPKWRFVLFNVTPFNDRVPCVCAPSGHSTRELLAKGHFFSRTAKLYGK